ncbi:hypothetical protein [Brevundimonas sp.]|uniref:hypothetical protein n=1 Tax=Brevundimonas sp. TaxID=1871086 RepID=UPI003BAD7E74
MIRLTCLASISLLALAACNAPEPAAPAPAASDPATAPMAPDASESPAADVLTSAGWGPLRVGMTVAEITAVAGADANPDAVGGADPATCDEFHPARAPEGLRVMIEDGRLARITVARNAAIKTDRGFGVGSSATDIKAAYGGGVVAQPHKYVGPPAEDLFAWSQGGSTAYVTDANARGIRYEIDGEGKVSMIHVGGPAIQLVEGCS